MTKGAFNPLLWVIFSAPLVSAPDLGAKADDKPDHAHTGHAMHSLLAFKLFGAAPHCQVMNDALEERRALFAGINCIPNKFS